MKISTVAFFVLVAMCYFPEGEGSEDADPDLSVMFACTRGPHMVGNRGSGRAPFCNGKSPRFRINSKMPTGYQHAFSNVYGQPNMQMSRYETNVKNYNDVAKCKSGGCARTNYNLCFSGKYNLNCWPSSSKFGTCEQMCHEPISKLRHGNVQANSFGPSHEPGFIHRTAGWQESSTPPVGMYNGMVVSTEIKDKEEVYCWCDMPQLSFKMHKNMTLSGPGTYYPDNYNVSNAPYDSANITAAMIWCQNENTCSGFTRVRNEGGLYEYVARGQVELTNSKATNTTGVEHAWLKTSFNSYNCYADKVLPKAGLSNKYPSGFDVKKPSYNMSARHEAERYCRSEPTCGGLTYLKSGKEYHWEPRQGTRYIFSHNSDIIGSILKTCPSEEKHCLSKAAKKMKISGKSMFDLSKEAPFNMKSFEEAAQYCELHPECGGIHLTAEKDYHVLSGNLFLDESSTCPTCVSWRKVC